MRCSRYAAFYTTDALFLANTQNPQFYRTLSQLPLKSYHHTNLLVSLTISHKKCIKKRDMSRFFVLIFTHLLCVFMVQKRTLEYRRIENACKEQSECTPYELHRHCKLLKLFFESGSQSVPSSPSSSEWKVYMLSLMYLISCS